jgi:hypothetical protein
VSSSDQDLSIQPAALKAAGGGVIRAEKASGMRGHDRAPQAQRQHGESRCRHRRAAEEAARDAVVHLLIRKQA